MGNFYWLHVKSLNHLHTELNLGYLKGTKFCLESKASFIDISSIRKYLKKIGGHRACLREKENLFHYRA